MFKWIRSKSLASVAVLALLSNGVILLGPSRLLAFAAGFVLICLLPGYLLTCIISEADDGMNWLEKMALSVGVGFAALTLGALGLQFIPGPLTRTSILAFYDGLVCLFGFVLFLRRSFLDPSKHRARVAPTYVSLRWPIILSVLLLIAAFLRFGNLGYSEFQGDEARAMLMAAGAIRGEDEILFMHRKGPVEILIPGVFYALYGATDELVARLPFAIANLTGLMCVYILARRMFLRRNLVALVAIGLLAVDGYLVAFGRIVQYQSIVFLTMALAIWCAYTWYRGGSHVLIWLVAIFLAVGILAHYETVIVAPSIAWLFCARARREGWPLRQWIRGVLGPSLVFVAIVGAFYVPFVCHPTFALTAQYITDQRVGKGWLYNNLSDFFWRATFYSSTYYFVFLAVGLVALVIRSLYASLRPAFLAVLVTAAFVAGLLAAAFFPSILVTVDFLAFFSIAVAMIVLLVSPRIKTEIKVTLLWFGLPCLIALFLTRKPKNHVYLMFPAWAVLAGVAFDRFVAVVDRWAKWSSWMERIRRWGLVMICAVLLTVFGYYVYIVFVRHRPNYLREYPAARLPFYLSVHSDELPRVGFFGFPHRSGWKAVGALYAQGVLQGGYGSDEEPLITSWYTRQSAWCPDAADYYFVTDPIQDAQSIAVDFCDEDHLLGRVWSGGQPVLEVYSRQPVGVPTDYNLAELESVFDAATQPDVRLWALDEPVPQYRVDAQLGEQANLIGYDAPRQVAVGEVLSVVLYWRSWGPSDRPYSVFVHVEVEGDGLFGQSDGPPACGSEPTTEWQPGRVVVDGHSLALEPSTSPGEYPMLVGLYDPATGERLPVSGRDTNPGGNAVYLGTVKVVAPASPQSSSIIQP
jgi:hypothetical protein